MHVRIHFLSLQFHIFNGGAEELYVYMNKDILPNEWGGKAGTFQELNGKYIIFLFYILNNINFIFIKAFMLHILFINKNIFINKIFSFLSYIYIYISNFIKL